MDLLDALEENSAILFMQLVMNVRSSYLLNFVEREIPRDVFMKYRNENMRKNMLDEIMERDPNAYAMLQNAPFPQIQAFVKQYNDSITGGVPSMPGVNPMVNPMYRPPNMPMNMVSFNSLKLLIGNDESNVASWHDESCNEDDA